MSGEMFVLTMPICAHCNVRMQSGDECYMEFKPKRYFHVECYDEERGEHGGGADARRITDAFERVEAQDEEIERLKQKIADQDDYIGTLEEDLENAQEGK